MGLALNLWVMFILWVGGALPGFEPPGRPASGVFFELRRLAFSAVTASMIAYLAAQFIDTQIFIFGSTSPKDATSGCATTAPRWSVKWSTPSR
jgi:hypothetical protein